MTDLADPGIARGRKWVKASAAGLLSLAATPIFAIMALLTALDGSPMDQLCSAGAHLSGMLPMYGLMSAFHSAPWLKLIFRR